MFLTVVASIIMQPAMRKGSSALSVMVALATAFLWVNLLSFMRPYQSTGTLLHVAKSTVSGLTGWFALLAVAAVAIGLSIFSLTESDEDGSLLASPRGAILATLGLFVGQVDMSELDDSPHSSLLFCVWVASVVVGTLVILNIVIASAIDSFQDALRSRESGWRRSQATVLLEQFALLSRHHQETLEQCLSANQWIHTLEPVRNGCHDWAAADVIVAGEKRLGFGEQPQQAPCSMLSLRGEVEDMKRVLRENQSLIKKWNAERGGLQGREGHALAEEEEDTLFLDNLSVSVSATNSFIGGGIW
ncbi:unnamed protein product [Chrysoparadoxa australica]